MRPIARRSSAARSASRSGAALHREAGGGEAAERKAAQVDGRAGTDQRVERAAERLQQRRQRIFAGRHAGQRIGIVKARHVGQPERAAGRQRLGIAQPVHPAAVAAVQQHQWRLRCVGAEAAPAHAHAFMHRVVVRRERVDARDFGAGLFQFHRADARAGAGAAHGSIR
jgi:hypothetical protein